MGDDGRTRYSTKPPQKTTHQQLRDDTSKAVKAFLKAGGKINRLPGPTESTIYKAGWNQTGIL